MAGVGAVPDATPPLLASRAWMAGCGTVFSVGGCVRRKIERKGGSVDGASCGSCCTLVDERLMGGMATCK
jgi:hypothetical protein